MDVNGDGFVDYVYPWGLEEYVFENTDATSFKSMATGVGSYPVMNGNYWNGTAGDFRTWDQTKWTGAPLQQGTGYGAPTAYPPDVPYVNLNQGNGTFWGTRAPFRRPARAA